MQYGYEYFTNKCLDKGLDIYCALSLSGNGFYESIAILAIDLFVWVVSHLFLYFIIKSQCSLWSSKPWVNRIILSIPVFAIVVNITIPITLLVFSLIFSLEHAFEWYVNCVVYVFNTVWGVFCA